MRDPRVDPQPGDVLIIGPQWQRERYEVRAVTGQVITYKMGCASGSFCCSLTEWRRWAKSAQVVTSGKEAA